MQNNLRFIAFAALLAVCVSGGAWAADSAHSGTVRDLQAAYVAEYNSFQRYEAFALKADEEGFPQAATLFRAVARAEQIHFTLLGDSIQSLGVVPVTDVVLPQIDSTKQNLSIAANNYEVTERDTLYPQLIKRAKADGDKKAGPVYDAIRKAEIEHYKLFTAAAKNLNAMRTPIKGYFVCAATGMVSTAVDPGNCSTDWEMVK